MITQHVCTNATLTGGQMETDKNGRLVAVIYTCSVCGARHRRAN